MNDITRYKVCSGMDTTPAAKLIFCYLLDLSDAKNGVTMSTRKLAKGIGLSPSAVRKNLHRLKLLGMITIHPRYTEDGGRLANQYTIV